MALGAIKKGARPWAEPLAESEPNNALEPTPSSVRCASASRRGSLPAFGFSASRRGNIGLVSTVMEASVRRSNGISV